MSRSAAVRTVTTALMGALVLMAVAASAASLGTVRFEGKDTSGMAGIDASAGETVVDGMLVVQNTGSRRAVLTGADLVGDVPRTSAAVVERRVLDLRRPRDLVGAARWPYEDYATASVPLDGFVLEPGAEAAVMFVVVVGRDGYWRWPKARIAYAVGGQRFSDTSTYGFEVCAPGCPDVDSP